MNFSSKDVINANIFIIIVIIIIIMSFSIMKILLSIMGIIVTIFNTFQMMGKLMLSMEWAEATILLTWRL